MRFLDEIQIFINIYIIFVRFMNFFPFQNLRKLQYQIIYFILTHNLIFSSTLFFIYGFYTGFQLNKNFKSNENIWKIIRNFYFDKIKKIFLPTFFFYFLYLFSNIFIFKNYLFLYTDRKLLRFYFLLFHNFSYNKFTVIWLKFFCIIEVENLNSIQQLRSIMLETFNLNELFNIVAKCLAIERTKNESPIHFKNLLTLILKKWKIKIFSNN